MLNSNIEVTIYVNNYEVHFLNFIFGLTAALTASRDGRRTDLIVYHRQPIKSCGLVLKLP